MPDTRVQTELLLEHGEFVRRLARGLVRDPDRADDVVQETWLAALRNPPRAREAATAWLRTAARNVAAKLDRGERRRATRERVVAKLEPTAAGTLDVVARLSLQRAVVDAVLHLNEPTRSAIVLRYFEDLSPTAIAERLGVPKNTVRARLRRGLERLRLELDRRHDGDRRRWLAAILPIAGFETAPIPASSASGATAGAAGIGGSAAAVGAWSMTVKSLSSLVAAAVLGLVAVRLVTLPDAPAPRVEHGDAVTLGHAARSPASSTAAPRPGDAGPAPAREVAAGDPEPADGSISSAQGAPAALPGAGVVALRPFDATTGESLPREVTARFLSDLRYAELEADGPVEALLSAGEWRASLRVPGYEDHSLDPFEVEAGGTTDLGWIPLERGSARIAGEARSHSVDPAPVTVELRGSGRSPCLACAPRDADGRPDADAAWTRDTPCTTCGYAEDRSVRVLAAGGTFSFEGLAAGSYLVSVRQGDAPLGVDEVVEVARGGTRWLDVQLRPGATAWFDLQDEHGRPFLREAAEGESVLQTVDFTFHRGEELVAQAHHVHFSGTGTAIVNGALFLADPGREARVLAPSPLLSYLTAQRSVHALEDVSFWTHEAQEEVTDGRLDRAREAHDALLPPVEGPSPPSARTEASRAERRGPVRVTPLPEGLLTVTATSDGAASDPVPLQCWPGGSTTTRLVLRPRKEAPPEEAVFDDVPFVQQEVFTDGLTVRFATSGGVARVAALQLFEPVLVLEGPPSESSASPPSSEDDGTPPRD